MNLNALKMRLAMINDKIMDGRSADAVAEVFDIIDDINAEQNPQPIVESYQDFNLRRDYADKPTTGWTGKGTK